HETTKMKCDFIATAINESINIGMRTRNNRHLSIVGSIAQNEIEFFSFLKRPIRGFGKRVLQNKAAIVVYTHFYLIRLYIGDYCDFDTCIKRRRIAAAMQRGYEEPDK